MWLGFGGVTIVAGAVKRWQARRNHDADIIDQASTSTQSAATGRKTESEDVKHSISERPDASVNTDLCTLHNDDAEKSVMSAPVSSASHSNGILVGDAPCTAGQAAAATRLLPLLPVAAVSAASCMPSSVASQAASNFSHISYDGADRLPNNFESLRAPLSAYDSENMSGPYRSCSSLHDDSLMSLHGNLSGYGRLSNATEEVLTETLSQHDSSQHGLTTIGSTGPSVAQPRGSPFIAKRSSLSGHQRHFDTSVEQSPLPAFSWRTAEVHSMNGSRSIAPLNGTSASKYTASCDSSSQAAIDRTELSNGLHDGHVQPSETQRTNDADDRSCNQHQSCESEVQCAPVAHAVKTERPAIASAAAAAMAALTAPDWFGTSSNDQAQQATAEGPKQDHGPKKQTSAEHNRGEVATLGSKGWLSTADSAQPGGDFTAPSARKSLNSENHKRLSCDSDRKETEVPAFPRTVRDGDVNEWVHAGLEATDPSTAPSPKAAHQANGARSYSGQTSFDNKPMTGSSSQQSDKPFLTLPSRKRGPAALHDISRRDIAVHNLLLNSKSLFADDGSGKSATTRSSNDQGVRDSPWFFAELRQVADCACWDLLATALAEFPPQWHRLLALVIDAREHLLQITVDKNLSAANTVRERLSTELDTVYVSQQLDGGYRPSYLRQLFGFLNSVVASQEAPHGAAATREAYKSCIDRFAAATVAHNSFSQHGQTGNQSQPGVPLHVAGGTQSGVSNKTRLLQTLPTAITRSGSSDLDDAEPATETTSSRAHSHKNNARSGLLRPGAGSATHTQLAPEVVEAIVAASRFIFDRIALLKEEITSTRMAEMQGLLGNVRDGIEYERRRFQMAIPGAKANIEAALPFTSIWLCSELNHADFHTKKLGKVVSDALVEGVLHLLQLPSAVEPAECPETFLLDRAHIIAAQNELQRLSLIAAALLIAAQLLAMKRLPPGTSSPENRRLFNGVRDRFSVLLAMPEVKMDDLVSELHALLQVRCIATTAVAAEGPESVASDKSVAGRLLSRIFNTDDPVFQEIQCGIVAALRLLLLEKSPAEAKAVLQSIGAELVADEVNKLAVTLECMLALNIAVCRPYYKAIVLASMAKVAARSSRRSIDLARHTAADAGRRSQKLDGEVACTEGRFFCPGNSPRIPCSSGV